jgi:cytochrome c oxidase subunit IV
MKVEGYSFLGIGAFIALIGIIYWFTSYEPTGTTLLGLSAVFGALPGVYLLRQSRHMTPRPEDRTDAEPSDGAGVVGSFPESSVWPFVLAGGAALTGIGLVFGLWASAPGVLILLIALVGAILESHSTH